MPRAQREEEWPGLQYLIIYLSDGVIWYFLVVGTSSPLLPTWDHLCDVDSNGAHVRPGHTGSWSVYIITIVTIFFITISITTTSIPEIINTITTNAISLSSSWWPTSSLASTSPLCITSYALAIRRNVHGINYMSLRSHETLPTHFLNPYVRWAKSTCNWIHHLCSL